MPSFILVLDMYWLPEAQISISESLNRINQPLPPLEPSVLIKVLKDVVAVVQIHIFAVKDDVPAVAGIIRKIVKYSQ